MALGHRGKVRPRHESNIILPGHTGVSPTKAKASQAKLRKAGIRSRLWRSSSGKALLTVGSWPTVAKASRVIKSKKR